VGFDFKYKQLGEIKV